VSARRIILDTDVASLSIKNALSPAMVRELLGAQVGIAFVTLAELHRWVLLRGWGSRRIAGLGIATAQSTRRGRVRGAEFLMRP
jgi:hypothetical protein